MGLLLKGSIENFLHSLKDYLERKHLTTRFPPGIFLWGAKTPSSLYVKGTKTLLYLTKNMFSEGGVALYGILQRPEELNEKYWPMGEWRLLLPIKVARFARGILEYPENPKKWRLIDRHKLVEIGIKVLPGTQKIPDEVIDKVIELLG